MPEAQFDLLHTPEQLEQLAPEWRALWRADAHATPFQSPEWLLPWVHAFGHRDLLVITVRREGALVGLVPLYFYTDPHTQKRQLLLIGAGTSDYLDGIFAPQCTSRDLEQALDTALNQPGWDQLCLTQVRAGSPLLHALRNMPTVPAEACSRTRAMRLHDLPRKLRTNVHYYRNRAQRLGSLDLHFTAEDDCLATFDALQRFHTERWQAENRTGVLADARVDAWHREALPQLARAGILRFATLRLAHETISALYCLIDPPGRAERTVYFYLPGFSMRHADLRPGNLLLAMAMDAAAQEGAVWFDFLRGDEAYKKLWRAEPVPTIALIENAERAGERASLESAA